MSTALAIITEPAVIEFRRCTGHCCDPVLLHESPGEFKQQKIIENAPDSDSWWIVDNLVYLGWRPPSKGGWQDVGTHEYRCRHFNKAARRCMIYGQGKRSPMCRSHPAYGYGPYSVCDHEGCTRRTMVLDSFYRARWMFPDLWKHDRATGCAYPPAPCEATAAPECQDERYER